MLLVHGWEGSARQFGALAGALASRGLQAVAFDAPAHGGSSGRLSSLPQFAEAICCVAARQGSLVAAVGHSFGASALGKAVLLGVRLPRLAFIAPVADLDRRMEEAARLLRLSGATQDEVKQRFERRLGVPWEANRRVLLDAASHAPPPPVLVVHDLNDAEAPHEEGQTVARTWPAAKLSTTSGLGHRRLLSDPNVINQVAAFVAGDDADIPRKEGSC